MTANRPVPSIPLRSVNGRFRRHLVVRAGPGERQESTPSRPPALVPSVRLIQKVGYHYPGAPRANVAAQAAPIADATPVTMLDELAAIPAVQKVKQPIGIADGGVALG